MEHWNMIIEIGEIGYAVYINKMSEAIKVANTK